MKEANVRHDARETPCNVGTRRETAKKAIPLALAQESQGRTASERPIDRFARLLADIRRTHPVTALMLSAEYVRCARADRAAWLARYLPGLEGEWGA
jgi:hypothetical protein